MALFTPDSFRTKLDKLLPTQESIETLSHWLLFHHRHADSVIDIWNQYILQSTLSIDKKLTLLYVMNDVVQKSKRKGQGEFAEGFCLVLDKVLSDPIWNDNDAQRQHLMRLISVWEERQIFPKSELNRFKLLTSVQDERVESTKNEEQKHTLVPNAIQEHSKLAALLSYFQKWSNALTSISKDSITEEDHLIHSRLIKLLRETLEEEEKFIES